MVRRGTHRSQVTRRSRDDPVAADSPTTRQTIVLIASFGPSLVNFRGPLIKSLLDLGHDVCCIAPSYPRETQRRLAAMGVAYKTAPMANTRISPLQDMVGFVRLWRLLRKIQPDTVLSYTLKPVIYGSLAAWFARVPSIYSMITGLGYAFSGNSLKQRLVRGPVLALLHLALRLNLCVFLQNGEDLQLLRDRAILRKNSRAVVVAGSGVDLDYFTPGPPPSGPVSFLLMTRLLRDKGVYEYVEAARQVQERHPGTRFLLLGPLDPNPNSVPQEQVDEWDRDGVVEYLGAADDVRPHLTAASVVVLPSYYREGMPRSIIEAMATGRAVVTTDTPGCRETVTNARNGFLVPPKDANALAQALETFLVRPELVSRMGAEGRRLAEERFDVHQLNALLINEMGLVRPQQARHQE